MGMPASVKKSRLTVGRRIREARRSRGLTQEQLARLLNVSNITVSRWERDIWAPREENLFLLAVNLGLHMEDLAA
jgi:transcriptional regulator with XRE-family HTH domain